MLKIFKIILPVTVLALAMSLMIGCSATGGSSTTSGTNQNSTSSSIQNQDSSSVQQTSNSSDTQKLGGQRPNGNGGPQMDQMLSRVAEILNISEEDFTAAFQEAMSANMPQRPSGSEQPPQTQGEPPQQPPEQSEGGFSNGQLGQRSGQHPGFDMQKIYEQLAEKLGISADDIASAFDQARQELNNQQ
jgi:hypothetical protein